MVALTDMVSLEKQRRVATLIARQKEISEEKNAAFIGREEEVLLEMVSRRYRALQSKDGVHILFDNRTEALQFLQGQVWQIAV